MDKGILDEFVNLIKANGGQMDIEDICEKMDMDRKGVDAIYSHCVNRANVPVCKHVYISVDPEYYRPRKITFEARLLNFLHDHKGEKFTSLELSELLFSDKSHVQHVTRDLYRMGIITRTFEPCGLRGAASYKWSLEE